MALAARTNAAPRPTGTEDSIVVLDGFTWADYERLLEIRGDRSAPRISYLKGRVEIMSPSRGHEGIKSLIGCLVEVWCLERGITFTTLGAWTQKEEALERGVEPDECYVIGEHPKTQRPHLAIEVIWTHGGLDKLEIYRRLGVGEVWIWEDDVLTPYVLRGDRYVETDKSEVFPDMDLAQLASFLDRPTTSRAILDYRAALRGGGSKGS